MVNHHSKCIEHLIVIDQVAPGRNLLFFMGKADFFFEAGGGGEGFAKGDFSLDVHCLSFSQLFSVLLFSKDTVVHILDLALS